VALVAFAAVLFSGLGWGWWTFGQAFAVLTWASLGAVLGAGLSVVGIIQVRRDRRRGAVLAVLGWSWVSSA
jgi:hypothetical protein